MMNDLASASPGTTREHPAQATEDLSQAGASCVGTPECGVGTMSLVNLLSHSVQWMASMHKLFGRNTPILKCLVAEARELKGRNWGELKRLRKILLDHHLTAAELLVAEIRNPLLELFVLLLRNVDHTKSHKPTKEELVGLCVNWKCPFKNYQCPLESTSANTPSILAATCQCATCKRTEFCRECMCSSCYAPFVPCGDQSAIHCEHGCGHAVHARCAIQCGLVRAGVCSCTACGGTTSLLRFWRDRLLLAAENGGGKSLASQLDLACSALEGAVPPAYQPFQVRVQRAKEELRGGVDPGLIIAQLRRISADAEFITTGRARGAPVLPSVPSTCAVPAEVRLGSREEDGVSPPAADTASRAMAAASAVASVCGGSLAGFQFAISQPTQMATFADLAANPLTAESARTMLTILGQDEAVINAVQAAVAAEMTCAPEHHSMARAQQRLLEEARGEVERLTRKAEVDAEVARRKREEATQLEAAARTALEEAAAKDLQARMAWQNVALTKQNLSRAFEAESQRAEGVRQEAYARGLEKMLERLRSATAHNLPPPPPGRGKGQGGGTVLPLRPLALPAKGLRLTSPGSSEVVTREGVEAKRRKGEGEGALSGLTLSERQGDSSTFTSQTRPGSAAAEGSSAGYPPPPPPGQDLKEAEAAVVSTHFPQHLRYLRENKYKITVLAAVGREFPNEWRLSLTRRKGKGARLQLPVGGLECGRVERDTAVVAQRLARQSLGLGEGAVLEVPAGCQEPIRVSEEQKAGVMHIALIHRLVVRGVAHTQTAYTFEGNYVSWCRADALYTIVRDVPQKFSATFPRALKCLEVLMLEKVEGWPIGQLLSENLVKQDVLG